MNKKYELTDETRAPFGITVYRIKALRDFGDVKAGDLGGFIEKEENLSHEGNCWVYNNAKVYDNAKVYGDSWVYGNAEVYNNAEVFEYGRVSGDAQVFDNAKIHGDAWIYGCVEICGDADISKDSDYAIIKGFEPNQFYSAFFRCKDNLIRVRCLSLYVKCRCFYGTLDEFRKQVQETHGDSKLAKEYLMIADFMEYHFS